MTLSEQGELKRQEILDFIVSYIKQHGYPPTVREIGKGVNLKSTSSVHSHLKKMVDDGVIKNDGAPRTIMVIGYEFKKVSD